MLLERAVAREAHDRWFAGQYQAGREEHSESQQRPKHGILGVPMIIGERGCVSAPRTSSGRLRNPARRRTPCDVPSHFLPSPSHDIARRRICGDALMTRNLFAACLALALVASANAASPIADKNLEAVIRDTLKEPIKGDLTDENLKNI